jgi:hypothetical protein
MLAGATPVCCGRTIHLQDSFYAFGMLGSAGFINEAGSQFAEGRRQPIFHHTI